MKYVVAAEVVFFFDAINLIKEKQCSSEIPEIVSFSPLWELLYSGENDCIPELWFYECKRKVSKWNPRAYTTILL